MMTGFLRELKRRRVLRTASLYVVGAWIALQVVEVLAEAGLPPSAMRDLLIVLSFGFPIALIIGWFFDITAEGVSRTGPLKEGEQLPQLKFIDHVLLVGLILVAAVDIYILSFPPVEDAPVVTSTASQQRTIAVLAFEDIDLAQGSDPVGAVFAGEIRSSLTRTAGLRVLGPQTSKMLSLAGENRFTMAGELSVTALLVGEVSLDAGRIRIDARLLGIPAGNEIWSDSTEGAMADAVSLQRGLTRQIIGATAPNLDPDPLQGARTDAGDCSAVYDVYLRGKQLTTTTGIANETFQRGRDLLREATEKDPHCAVAWEALAQSWVDWTLGGTGRNCRRRRALVGFGGIFPARALRGPDPCACP
jgi:TolB-like protein